MPFTESGLHLGPRYRKEWLSIGARGAKGYAVVHVDGRDAEDAADTWGRHLCAAVNACAGIPTEVLRDGAVAALLTALEEATALLREHADFSKHLAEQAACEKANAAIAKARGRK